MMEVDLPPMETELWGFRKSPALSSHKIMLNRTEERGNPDGRPLISKKKYICPFRTTVVLAFP
ncbi:hypothetical protein DPMN_071093 [Dreissena polymorpha]|uniref:Uncharacterized protein n=1 Tax=Dreissena polymorpha TaxID=45954 RepID=A0A9D4BVZ5_DREPO|nr:hypothetical protein DPMN_071093 [Dreissena polymorpha]